MKAIAEESPRFKARIAGLFALLEAVTSGFGQVIVPRMLVVSGNAAATASNILAHGLLFKMSIVAGIVGSACHIVWTLLFYELFKPVSRSLALLAAFFSLVAIAMQIFSTVLQLGPLVVLQDAQWMSVFNRDQLEALALMFMRLYAQAFGIYLVFFGFWCVLTGYLITKSTFMPRVIGILEGLAGLCWLTFIWLPLAHFLSPFNQIVAAIGEISLMLWMLIFGVNSERWQQSAAHAE